MRYPRMRWLHKGIRPIEDNKTRNIVRTPPKLQYEVSDDDGKLTWTDVPEVYEDEQAE